MPAPVRSASARLAARLVAGVPSAMSIRSSAAPSGVRLRAAPSTSTVAMNVSFSPGSCWPSTRGIARQVAVSSSARSGSPDSIPAHRPDITSLTMASAWACSAGVGLASGPVLVADAVLVARALLIAGAWLAARALRAGVPRRDLVFLLTASSYGSQPTKFGVQRVPIRS